MPSAPVLPQKLIQAGLVWRAESPDSAGARTPLPGTDRQLSIPFGDRAIDDLFPKGGLAFQTLHEFYTSAGSQCPPYTIPAVLAGNAVRRLITVKQQRKQKLYYTPDYRFEKLIVWVGRRLWPAPYLIKNAFNFRPDDSGPELDLLPNCLFIDPPDAKLAWWCTETLLRSPAVAAVIADLSRTSFALTRKLCLAAKSAGAAAFIIRPLSELQRPSSAATRWLISPCPSDSGCPKWRLELTHCKGVQPSRRSWIVEEKFDFDSSGDPSAKTRTKVHLSVSAAMVGGSGQLVPEEKQAGSR
jgi:hypothetical protein